LAHTGDKFDAVELLQTVQIDPAVQILARAFQDDPTSSFLVPDPKRRATMLAWSFGVIIRYGLLHGEVYITANLDGVACWLPPGKTNPTTWGLLRAGMYLAPLKVGWDGVGRMLTFVQYTDRVHEHRAPFPHWYLAVLGVEPARQGQGVGTRLIDTVRVRADAAGIPCYLETQNPRNVPFYENRGFKVVDHGPISKGGPWSWAMLREPGSGI